MLSVAIPACNGEALITRRPRRSCRPCLLPLDGSARIVGDKVI